MSPFAGKGRRRRCRDGLVDPAGAGGWATLRRRPWRAHSHEPHRHALGSWWPRGLRPGLCGDPGGVAGEEAQEGGGIHMTDWLRCMSEISTTL